MIVPNGLIRCFKNSPELDPNQEPPDYQLEVQTDAYLNITKIFHVIPSKLVGGWKI